MQRRDRGNECRTWIFVLGPSAAMVLSLACAQAPHVEPKPVVRLATGTPGGGFYPLGERLALEFSHLLPDVSVEADPTAGAVTNVEALQSGDADLALTFADVAYLAYAGELNPSEGTFDRLRGIAVLARTPLHLVVRRDLAFRQLSDLRGRRVGVGPPGSGTALTARLVFEAFGLDASTIETQMLPFDEAARKLVEGSLDAMFDSAIYPGESVSVATRAGARLVPLTGASIDRLHHDYPFLKTTLIPGDAYPGIDAVHTIGVDTLLICRSDLNEALVYELTRAFFDALPALSSAQNELRSMNLDRAPATPIPLHAGAARYYRERELLR